MGNNQSHKRNVRERHTRALYVNIPISSSFNSSVVAASSRIRISKHPSTGQSYLSIVIDDLCDLEAWIGIGYLTTPMSGWMMKFNILVDVDLNGVWNPAYQILTLDFEQGLGGRVKKLGAIATQKVPTETSIFNMSCGISGQSTVKEMVEDAPYSAVVETTSGDILLKVVGKLTTLKSDDEKDFAKFVMERPHKVLSQSYGKYPAHAPENGEGAMFSADGVMRVALSEPLQAPMIEQRLRALISNNIATDATTDSSDESSFDLDMSAAMVLLQPEYTLVDHTNLLL